MPELPSDFLGFALSDLANPAGIRHAISIITTAKIATKWVFLRADGFTSRHQWFCGEHIYL
jgi:hypothetical protein